MHKVSYESVTFAEDNGSRSLIILHVITFSRAWCGLTGMLYSRQMGLPWATADLVWTCILGENILCIPDVNNDVYISSYILIFDPLFSNHIF
jgi:hypothetical protein